MGELKAFAVVKKGVIKTRNLYAVNTLCLLGILKYDKEYTVNLCGKDLGIVKWLGIDPNESRTVILYKDKKSDDWVDVGVHF